MKYENQVIPLDEIKNIIEKRNENPKPIYVISKNKEFPGTLGCSQGWCQIDFRYKYGNGEKDEISVYTIGWDCPMYVKLSEYNKTWFAYYENPKGDEYEENKE